MRLSSPVFRHGQPIPPVYTCKGADASPALEWTDVPAGTACFALIVDDPDAPRGTWTHWTFWNLPGHLRALPESADVTALGGVLGTTSARMEGYHGPCPPSGRHRYNFTLHALRTPLALRRGASVDELRAALSEASLAQAQLQGTFAA